MTTPAAPLRVLVWGENRHEQIEEKVRAIYPDGMHTVIAAALREHHPHATVSTATLQEPDHGITAERLATTDVLFWWGHAAHDEVSDAVVDLVAWEEQTEQKTAAKQKQKRLKQA